MAMAGILFLFFLILVGAWIVYLGVACLETKEEMRKSYMKGLIFNHPFDDYACVNRLIREIREHGKLYIAYDFDNTIFDYHKKGGNYQSVIDLLVDATKDGHIMILFTTETDPDKLQRKKEIARGLGIGVDFVNECPPISESSKKPYYNILLDDRAGLESSYKILRTALNLAKTK